MLRNPKDTVDEPCRKHMTIEQYKQEIYDGKNKFGAIKTVCGHKHTHDSKKEAVRCDQLCLLEKARAITKLKQQEKFVLQKPFWCCHEHIRAIHYIADFTYYEDGVLVIEDVKGKCTDVFLLKKKMLLNKLKARKNWKFIET